jgi:RNA polymerase sigma factor (sigma-70 family)
MNKELLQEKFMLLIKQHKGILYKITNSYCKHIEDRKDLLQEIIVQLWNSFEKYNSEHKYSTWMYRIALNVSISFYRKENRREKISNPLTESIINFTQDDDDGSQILESELSKLQNAINELKELDKALILLYLEEKSYKEIASIIGLSETNISTKIARIKTILKQKLS